MGNGAVQNWLKSLKDYTPQLKLLNITENFVGLILVIILLKQQVYNILELLYKT